MSSTVRPSDDIKARVIWDLKIHGDVESALRGAQSVLVERLKQNGLTLSSTYLHAAIAELEEEGCLTRRRSGMNVRSINFITVGNYSQPEDRVLDGDAPNEPQTQRPFITPDDEAERPVPVRATTKRSNNRMSKILSDIDKLSLPDKLMIAGEIADQCAGEIESVYAKVEAFEKLRSVIGKV